MVSKVTKPFEHHDHLFPIQGHGLVKLAHPHLFGIFRVTLVGGILT
jgi:hypothetical protein